MFNFFPIPLRWADIKALRELYKHPITHFFFLTLISTYKPDRWIDGTKYSRMDQVKFFKGCLSFTNFWIHSWILYHIWSRYRRKIYFFVLISYFYLANQVNVTFTKLNTEFAVKYFNLYAHDIHCMISTAFICRVFFE